MSGERLLVIGGNAAGMTAAAKAGRIDKDLNITVIERTPHISYAP
jgi:NADPH-dependent 2,4-dienoyl-CoA reductase/sulfur reductase-like enzyme